MLYPRESEAREVKDLSGIWEFKADKNNEGFEKKWFASPLEDTIMMPVPASYNDMTQDASIRDHIGDVWYEKDFFVPASWRAQRVVIRVGSATHKAILWVNGIEAARHKGGYMPFEADITDILEYGKKNRVTLAVDNILDWTTIPPGEVKTLKDDFHPEGYRIQEYFHDFYNYAGIHRPVLLYTTPREYISDIYVSTDIKGLKGIVKFKAEFSASKDNVRVSLLDGEKEIASAACAAGEFVINEARFWEPGNAYLYTLCVRTSSSETGTGDCYRLPVGIRTIKVTEKEFLINGKPFYFKGFGKHEDMDIAGKGLNQVINVKDFNLLKWIGANSFRTSHYPYSEEVMDLADREGIVVIDETPAVGFNFWNRDINVFCEERVHNEALENHLQVIREMISRDRNHPCVVMWSVANEAATYEEGAVPYFKRVAGEVRKLDSERPVTIVQSGFPKDCKVAQYFDIVCVNRYYSWYSDPGHLELIQFQLENELRGWHERFKQPVILSEYGADAITGFHQDPPVMFSEDYQCEFLRQCHNVLDKLDFIVGEHVWNFADFATKQGVTRIIGNRKGVFTRQRQPKAAAHLLRDRWILKEKV